MVIKCENKNCKSDFQDKAYGKGMRVHNFAVKGNGGTRGHRCTVCGTVTTSKNNVGSV